MANIIITTGGTGGHIFPARCLAEELANNNHKVVILADKNYANYVGKDDKFGFKIISCSQFRKSFSGLTIGLVKIAYGVLQSLVQFLSFDSKIIIAFGGYATFAPLIAAVLTGKKIILHEQNAHLGKVNRMFLRFANKLILSFSNTEGIDPKFLPKTVFLGNFVRKEILEIGKSEYQLPSPGQNFNILVIGGSGGAKIFSEILPKAFSLLPTQLKNIIHVTVQCRNELLEHTTNQYKAFDIKASLSHFFNDINQQIKGAHLVIARAGSSSIFELCAAKRPMILVPFANASDDHQKKNANQVQAIGAAIVIEELDFTADKIAAIIKNLISENQNQLLTISKQCQSLINEQAAKELAAIVNVEISGK